MKLELAPPVLLDQPADLAQPLGETATRAKSAGGTFAVQRYRFTSGKREGVELVVVDSGKVRAAICPTRGMGIWKAILDGLDCSLAFAGRRAHPPAIRAACRAPTASGGSMVSTSCLCGADCRASGRRISTTKDN